MKKCSCFSFDGGPFKVCIYNPLHLNLGFYFVIASATVVSFQIRATLVHIRLKFCV